MVQWPFGNKDLRSTSKERSKALKQAHYKIKALQDKVRTKEKVVKRLQKRLFRQAKTSKKKTAPETPEKDKIIDPNDMTPRTKTTHDIRSVGLSPKSLPKSIVKDLEFGNCLVKEINDSLKKNKTQQEK